jgi:hypothetical protein
MAKWKIEYFDEDTNEFVEFSGYNHNEVYEELTDTAQPHLYFYLFNTAENRALLQQDLIVAAYFDNVLQFTGILQGGDVEDRPGKIKFVVYDDFLLTLDQAESFTGAYEKPANIIISAILSGSGYTCHASTPTTVIPVVFYHANRLDAIRFMQKALACDVWHSGTTAYFGTQGGTTHTPTTITFSRRGIDRSKQATKVEVRGTDVTGFHILGVAGTGTKVKTFNEEQMTDEVTLNAIAAKKLAELTSDSSGLPVSVLMSEGKAYELGDSVTIVNDRYLLNGTYRIMQMTKTKFKCNMQLDKARKTAAATVDELKGWEQKGIYTPGSEAWVICLQGLVGLFHLAEGTGTLAKNSCPSWAVPAVVDGSIQNCNWEDGPVTKMLTFNGTNAAVTLGDASKTGINLSGKCSFGGWFSPSANDSTKRYVCHKDSQFALSYKVSTGVLTAEINISGVLRTYNSDADLIKVGGRCFAMITYDGTTVSMYYNGWIHKSWTQAGLVDSQTTNTVYLGVFLKGVLAEVMLWSRALVDQEVLELYFFPLFRVSGGGSTSGWYCGVSVSNDQHGTTDPSGVTVVPKGQTLTVTATRINQATFLCWRYDSVDFYSTDNPVTIPAEADGSKHTLIAIFQPPIAIGLPTVCTLAALPHTEIASPELAPIATIAYTGIASPTLASIATIAAASIVGYKWIVNVVNDGKGTFDSSGNVLVDADATETSAIDPLGGTLSYTSIKALHPSASASISAVVQSFKGCGGKLYAAAFKIKKYGAPVGNLRAALYAHTGTFGTSSVPTGALIEDSTDVAMAGIPTDDFYWTFFTFADTTTMTAGTHYTIVLYAKSVTTLNTTNYLQIYDVITSSTTHEGNYSQYASSAWSATATTDLLFAVISGNAGTTLAVVATPAFANGYVFQRAAISPLLFDGVGVGTVAGSGLTASYTIPEQLALTRHTLVNTCIKGWGATSSQASPTGYYAATSGTGVSYTAQGSAGSGYHWHLWLDGTIDLGHSPKTVSAQTDGTIHVITQVATPN